MVPNLLDVSLLFVREGGIRITSLGSLEIGRNACQAEKSSRGIPRSSPDDDRGDKVRRFMGGADEASLSLPNFPQDFSEAVSPSSRDLKTSHENAISYRLSSMWVLPNLFHDVLSVETVAAAVQEVFTKLR